ncbi:MAG: LAGLIDADG family homing endonuclease, partial [Candidatus Sigynarchaeum springense]
MVMPDDVGVMPPQDPVAKFEDFLRLFEDPVGTFVYLNKIKYIIADSEKTRTLTVDFTHLMRHDPQLAKEIHENPTEYLKKANQAAVNVLHAQSNGAIKLTDEYFVRFTNMPSSYCVKLRKIRSAHMERLLGVSGSLIRATNVRPEITTASFECKVCGAQHEIEQLDEELTYPAVCNVGGCKNSKKSDFRLIGKTSRFIDWQQIRIQEMPEELSAGNVPRYLDALLLHDIVDTFRPGDRVTLVGTIKIAPIKKSAQGQGRVFMQLMHVNNIYSEEEAPSEEITEEDEEKIKALAKDPFIHTKIIRSISPGLYGLEMEKLACALSLFGGVHKVRGSGHNMRGDIHVLLMGDPGTGKSQLIKAASRLAPRGIYTSGQGSTAAGLTAAVLRDETTGNMVLEAGALVLADNGVAVIDEFDKMKTADRVAIHEGMEQQSYHPLTEILTTDGHRIKIGPFIDQLMARKKNQVVEGINCEILPVDDLWVYSTDGENVVKARACRVSRHAAPAQFIKLSFSNGRSLMVTPEHPVFVYRDGTLKEIPAAECKENEFVPVPNILPNSSIPVELERLPTPTHPRAKCIRFPRTISPGLARLLGYIISEGHGFAGSTVEVGFSNKDDALLDDFQRLMLAEFNMRPSINKGHDGVSTLRYVSVELYKWMRLNFPEMMVKAREKRIPAKILGGSKAIAREFLASAFKGDGGIESTSLCYRTASEYLSHDYQDLLLKLGIQSRIVHDIHNDSYKVYIRGHSLYAFLAKVIERDDPRYEKFNDMIKASMETNRHHDVFPTSVAKELIALKKELGLAYNGRFNSYLQLNYGITRDSLEEEIFSIETHLASMKHALDNEHDIKKLREACGYSMADITRITGIGLSVVKYVEIGGYTPEKRRDLSNRIRNDIAEHVRSMEKRVANIKRMKDAQIGWDRIKKIEIIENSGEKHVPFVYDITVEPSHTFIAQGIVLHNSISISKAGIVANLNCRTTIIAAANPKMGRYDDNLTLAENINLPPTLLSRFDLIFIVRDRPDEKNDGLVADHILKLHMPEDKLPPGQEIIEAPIEASFLKKYIRYARAECEPQMTPEA